MIRIHNVCLRAFYIGRGWSLGLTISHSSYCGHYVKVLELMWWPSGDIGLCHGMTVVKDEDNKHKKFEVSFVMCVLVRISTNWHVRSTERLFNNKGIGLVGDLSSVNWCGSTSVRLVGSGLLGSNRSANWWRKKWWMSFTPLTCTRLVDAVILIGL